MSKRLYVVSRVSHEWRTQERLHTFAGHDGHSTARSFRRRPLTRRNGHDVFEQNCCAMYHLKGIPRLQNE